MSSRIGLILWAVMAASSTLASAAVTGDVSGAMHVSSIADLRRMTAAQMAAAPVVVDGFYGADSAGGGVFDFSGVLAQSCAANGFTCIRASDNPAVGMIRRIVGGWYDVAMFGAKCDGKTIDSAAFAAARDAAGPSGKIRISAGTCPLAITLNKPGQTWDIRPGATLLELPGTHTGSPMILITAPGVTLQGGGTIDGNADAVDQACLTTYNCHIIDAAADSITIQNLTIRDAMGICLYSPGASNLSVIGNRFERCESISVMAGVYRPRPAAVHGIKIVANQFDTTGVVHNQATVGGLLLTGGPAGDAFYPNQDAVISRNISHLRREKDTNTLQGLENSVVSDNVAYYGFLPLTITDSDHIMVSGNNAFGPGKIGECIELSGSRYVTATANQCDGNDTVSRSILLGQSGISKQYSDHITINGDISSNLNGPAIWLDHTTNVDINNIITRCKPKAFQGCIFLLGQSINVTVNGGDLDGGNTAAHALLAVDSSNVTMTGVKIRNFTGSAVHVVGTKGVIDRYTIKGNRVSNVKSMITTDFRGNARGGRQIVVKDNVAR